LPVISQQLTINFTTFNLQPSTFNLQPLPFNLCPCPRAALSYNLALMFTDPQARPLSVTISGIGVFLFGLVNAWRALALFNQADLLLELDVAVDPRLRAVIAGGWALLFLGAVVALWRRQPASRLAVPLLLGVYALYEMGLLLFLVQSPVARQGWPADTLFYATLIILAAWLLNRRVVRSYFRD
jgi:hypothetical protein